MATQALLKSLCYDPRGQDTEQQTKAGLPDYDNNPYDFEQWHFVVMGKYDAYASKKDVETSFLRNEIYTACAVPRRLVECENVESDLKLRLASYCQMNTREWSKQQRKTM